MTAKILYLSPRDRDPDKLCGWILIEEAERGVWYSTGFGKDNDGRDVVYISSPKVDTDFDVSLSEALKWAASHSVDEIYVRRLDSG